MINPDGSLTEPSRQSDWDGVAACHRGLRAVTTWSLQRFSMGEHRLLPERFTNDKKYASVTAQVRPSSIL